MKRIEYRKDWKFYESEEGNSFIFTCPPGETVDIPHDFILPKPRRPDAAGGPSNGYFGNGQGVYRKTLDIPADWKGKTLLLDIDGAYMNMEVSLNREVLAMHPNGYIPYQVDLTPALRFDGRKNRLKIITQSRQPSSRWYSGGGLYRDVCLWVGNPIHIKPWDLFVVTELTEKSAIIKIHGEITSPETSDTITMFCCVEDHEGNLVGQWEKKITVSGKSIQTAEISLEEYRLWNLDDPYLYNCKVFLKRGENILDSSETAFGIRTISANAKEGFSLNGRTMKIKGGCIHHDNGFLGACAYPKAEERKIKMLKAAGYNAVRISHYPPSLELLNICDRLGMLVLDEAFDVWNLGKMPMDYHLYFADWWARDIENMVKRDRNHPCVISYSIGNEIHESNGKNNGAKWSEKLSAKVRQFDNTRFVLSAICGIQPDIDDEDLGRGGNLEINMQAKHENWNRVTADYCKPLDIVGYNYLKDIYEESHEMFPERVILGAETYPFQTYDYWEKTKALPYVIGDCIWAAVDYLGEAGVGRVFWKDDIFDLASPFPWRSSWQSDFDLTGEQRPQSIYREIMWGKSEKSGLFTTHPKHYGEKFRGSNWHWYDVNDSWTFGDNFFGKPVKADVYGDGDYAEFFLNGKNLGKVPFHKLIASMDIEYEPGILEAIIWKNDKKISRSRLQTTGKAQRLTLHAEEPSVKADGLDLVYVRAVVQDAAGNRLTHDQREITVDVSGAGELLAVGSGNPCTEDHITDVKCHMYRGTAILIVKAKSPGEIHVKVTASGVESAHIMVEAL